MAFTDTQLRQLKAKLDPRHVRTRRAATLHYVEGWHVIAEANRIFGFDGWDRETVSTNCVASGKSRGDYLVAYTAKVRITVRAGKTVVVREGSGTGEAKGFSLGQAHELALKSAETDATKRALASFGNSFGLALYDPEQNGIKGGGAPKEGRMSPPAPLALYSAAGEVVTVFDNPKEFAQALHQAMLEASHVDDLFAVWQQNVETVRALHRLHRWNSQLGVDGIALVTHLKPCARRFADSTGSEREPQSSPAAALSPLLPAKIDKSLLTISEPKRIRCKEHLRFVAQQPCLICGRTPSQAHHVRYAQPRGLGLKVSDEFTVPLCAIHHSENHATGDERRWWQDYKIDPLSVASGLWTGDGDGRAGRSD